MCAARKADLEKIKPAILVLVVDKHAVTALTLGYLVSGCDATHWRRASALQTRFDWCAVSVGGLIDG